MGTEVNDFHSNILDEYDEPTMLTAYFTVSQDPEFIELVRELEVKTGQKVLVTTEEVMLEKLKRQAKWGV